MRYFQAMNRGGLRALGTIAGSLFIGIPLLSHAANAQLYNYDQYNMNDEILPGTTLITPQDPTRQTLKPGGASSATPTPAQPGVLQPPLPSTRQDPIAYVQPTNGAVSVQLINRTGAPVRYEAIQDTGYRLLPPDASVMLQGLNLPTTIALNRADGGFIQFVTESQPGMLTLNLYPTSRFNDNAGAVRIQAGGAVYLN